MRAVTLCGLALIVACGAKPTSVRPTVAPPVVVEEPEPEPTRTMKVRDAPGEGFADPDRAERVAALADEIRARVEAKRVELGVPAIAYAVVIDDRIVVAGGTGTRTVGKVEPVDEHTAFRIGSITKVITAMAVLKLRDGGELALDEPAADHLPELAAVVYPSQDAREITIRDLLTHTSGLPRLGDFDYTEHEPDNDEVFAALDGLELVHPPGEHFQYSNFGFQLLGLLVERVAGQPYERYVTEQILAPLGIDEAGWCESDFAAEHLATAHDVEDGATVPILALARGATAGAGGLFMSAQALGKLAAYQLGAWPARSENEREPLRRATLRESQTAARFLEMKARTDPREGLFARANGIGYAWQVYQDCRFAHGVWHGGATRGHRATLDLLPRRGVALVVLANRGKVAVDAVAFPTLQWLVEEARLEPRVPQPFPEVEHAARAILGRAAEIDEPGVRALLEPAFVDKIEPEVLQADLQWLHDQRGACEVSRVEGAPDAWSAALDLACAHGPARMRVWLSPQSKRARDFIVIAVDGRPTAPVAAGAEVAVALLDRWNDERFAEAFSPSFPAPAMKEFLASVRGRAGRCRLAGTEETRRLSGRYVLACTKGDRIMTLAVDEASPHRIARFTIRPREPDPAAGERPRCR